MIYGPNLATRMLAALYESGTFRRSGAVEPESAVRDLRRWRLRQTIGLQKRLYRPGLHGSYSPEIVSSFGADDLSIMLSAATAAALT